MSFNPEHDSPERDATRETRQVGLWLRAQVLGGLGDLVSWLQIGVIIGVSSFRVLISLLITYLLSPLGLEVGFVCGNQGLSTLRLRQASIFRVQVVL